MAFRDWLLEYNDDDIIGDLANDVRRDPPEGNWDAKKLRAHMRNRRACDEAFEALKDAVSLYKSLRFSHH